MTVSALLERLPEPSRSQCIAALGRAASIEINAQDLQHIEASRALLPTGKKIYVSHLPKQRWERTVAACRSLRASGFDPVPHIPVRLIADHAELDHLLGALTDAANIREVLLISGDYSQAAGPYSTTQQALSTGVLQKHEITRVSFAGHPEGHPRVPLQDIRRAEIDKALYAQQAGLEATFVTQFCFESAPFLGWARELRSAGVRARLVAGIAGPAKLATLVNFALRCGVGRSIRALGARPGVMSMLMTEHAPTDIISELARSIHAGETAIDGFHVFCFGGYLRACRWLQGIVDN
jgi:methylenetetrahydrofolate reductase (NADPH)